MTYLSFSVTSIDNQSLRPPQLDPTQIFGVLQNFLLEQASMRTG